MMTEVIIDGACDADMVNGVPLISRDYDGLWSWSDGESTHSGSLQQILDYLEDLGFHEYSFRSPSSGVVD